MLLIAQKLLIQRAVLLQTALLSGMSLRTKQSSLLQPSSFLRIYMKYALVDRVAVRFFDRGLKFSAALCCGPAALTF